MPNSADEQREKEKRASEAAAQAQGQQKSGCLIGGIVFVILAGVFGSAVGEGGAVAILAVAVIVGIVVAVSNKNKTETAVVQATQQVESIQESRRREMDAVFSFARNAGLVLSKTVINPTNTACLALDSSREEFLVKDSTGHKILKFNQLVSYELCKDGSSIVSGDASGAIVGGLLFGTVGAVAGAAGSSKNVNPYCSEMYISVVDDSAHRYKLPLISETVFESSQEYKVAIERAREMLSILSVIDSTNKKKLSQNTHPEKSFDTPVRQISNSSTIFSGSTEDADKNNKTEKFSEADEIKKFRMLADSGIISEEEFEAKKKQLLGL